jgi:hypothetical protein
MNPQGTVKRARAEETKESPAPLKRRRVLQYQSSDSEPEADDQEWVDCYINFGKHNGQQVSELVVSEKGRDYLRWISNTVDFKGKERLQKAVTFHLELYANYIKAR